VSDSFDLIIVGSGSGNSIPDYLSDWRIALVERDVFGGTCLNRGCIPSKMFVLPADLALECQHGDRIGVNTSFGGADWVAIRDRVFGRIDPIAAGGKEYRASGTPNVELITETARFVGPHQLDVGGRQITAPKILLAAGARPIVPPIAGLADVAFHTSDTIMRIDALPARLGVIGAGFIAAEMGHVFSAFGSEVHIFSRTGIMVRDNDDEIVERFNTEFGKRATIHTGGGPTSVSEADGVFTIDQANGPVEVDMLLVAAGRRPNGDLLEASVGGLATTADGRILVDDTMATSVPGVWAVGDVANTYHLKHLANAEAKVAFWNIANPDSEPKRQSYAAVPSAVFSNPQIASVGMTEQHAVEFDVPHRVGRRDFGGTAYGWALEDESGMAKVIVSSETGLILGAHVIGPQSASLIQPLIQAMELGQTADQVANEVFYIHPALTEVVENALLEAL
jgi:mycothione reductase